MATTRKKKAPPKAAKPSKTTAAETMPAPSPEATGITRAQVIAAAFAEARERGALKRDALDSAEDIADRLRLIGHALVFGGTSPMRDHYDLRNEQDYRYPHGRRKTRMAGLAPVMRRVEDIDTLVLHQTAVEYGVSDRAVREAGGDVELARARRALDAACHVMVFRKGYYVESHPLLALVSHAGRLNPRSIGLEIEGRYPGLMDDPSTLPREDLETTWGGDPTVLTEAAVKSACNAIDKIMIRMAELGGRLRYVAPHRISSDARRADPGQEPWQRIALDYAVAVHGLEPVNESPWTQGRHVPTEWDPENGIGEY